MTLTHPSWISAIALGGALLLPASAGATDAAPHPATRLQKQQNQAKGMALAEQTARQISDVQLQVADRVLTGDAHCEFNQKVSVLPIKGKPGHFHVGFKKAVYTMVPEETTTGAVRLEDKKAGIVWLQIPAKSMLMNHKIGQRMVDGCMHSEQTAAVAAVEAAGRAASAASGKN